MKTLLNIFFTTIEFNSCDQCDQTADLIELFHQERAGLLFLDLGTPTQGQLETLEFISQKLDTPPIVLFSASAREWETLLSPTVEQVQVVSVSEGDFTPAIDRAVATASYCRNLGGREVGIGHYLKRDVFKDRFHGYGITFYVGRGYVLVGAYRLDSTGPGGYCPTTALHGCDFKCRSASDVDEGVNHIWAQMIKAGL